MSWNLNRLVIIGRLSKDVELSYTPTGSPLAKFSIAVGGKPKPDGTDSVSFFNVVIWGKQAENCNNYLAKGKLVGIDGRIEQRSWTAQDGSKKSVVEIIAERVEFLSPIEKTGGNQNIKENPYSTKIKAPSESPFEDDFYGGNNEEAF